MHFEGRTRRPRASTLYPLRATLKAAGIIFLKENGAIGAILHSGDPREK